MEWIKDVLDRFESFLKRAFLPSMVFYFFVILFGVFDADLLKKMKLIVEEKNFAWIFIVFSIGLSYFLNMLHQLVFDNNIKENYDTKYFWTKENNVLKELREKVLEKLEKDELTILDKDKYNDYVLYQIIGGKVKKISKRYVDDAKTYGIVFLSFVMATLVLGIKTEKFLYCGLLGIYMMTFFIVWESIKAKYRSRVIRFYINYLQNNNKETNNENLEEKDDNA